MKNSYIYLLICPLLLIVTVITSCRGQENTNATRITPRTTQTPYVLKPQPIPTSSPQIAEYIRNMYQDKNGNFWFGTNGYGVAHYNGDSITYFSIDQGFDGYQVTGITEDLEKNIWFATDQGVVKYDWSSNNDNTKKFNSYFNQDRSGSQRFWSIYADSKGHIWAGEATQVFRFADGKWAPFKIPFPEEITGEFITSATSWGITEDAAGNMWFSTNGYGAYKYDGQSFTQYTEEDGLSGNSVDNILQDSKGNMWFGTRFHGVSRYDGETFVNYTSLDSLGDDEVCIIYEDSTGDIWMSSEGYGVYRFDGTSFINYSEKQGLGVKAVQTIFEDKEGRLWVGGGGGLYRYDGESFFNVTKNGPWE